MRARMAVLSASAALLAVLCAGCGSVSARAGSGGTDAAASAVSTALPDGAPDGGTVCPAGAVDSAFRSLSGAATASPSPLGTPLPVDFRTVAVVRCVDVSQSFPGGGVWNVALAQRATTGLQPLLTALRLPSQSPPTGQYGCSAVGIVLPNFALVGAHGQFMRPGLPHDACGMPLTKALDALNALPWKTEISQKLDQIQSPAEQSTGCPNGYKDVFGLHPAPIAPTAWPAEHGAASVTPTTACEYTVTQPSTNGNAAVGSFTRGLKLGSSQQKAIAAAYLRGTVPKIPCTSQATKFALLSVGTDYIAVELDGCLRTSYTDFSTTQTPADVLGVLRSVGIG